MDESGNAQCQTNMDVPQKNSFSVGKCSLAVQAGLGVPVLNCLTKSAQPKRPLAAGPEVFMTCIAEN